MSRTVALLLLACILSGCRGSTAQGPVDPFLGPTRVPAPTTGSVYAPPPESYYYSPPQHTAPQYAPQRSGGTTNAFPAGASAQSAEHPGDPVAAERWSAVPSFASAALISEAATPDFRPQPPQLNATAHVPREPIIRILEPRPRPAATPNPAPHHPAPTRVVNIVDLPRATEVVASGFRLVSAEEPVPPANPVATAVAQQPVAQFTPSAGSYGFDPSYAWLRGKLEYSQVDRLWKLRYIPVDGTTDSYGGSVIIANEAALAGAERGEFVAVHGRVVRGESERGFAPVYEVTALQRLSR